MSLAWSACEPCGECCEILDGQLFETGPESSPSSTCFDVKDFSACASELRPRVGQFFVRNWPSSTKLGPSRPKLVRVPLTSLRTCPKPAKIRPGSTKFGPRSTTKVARIRSRLARGRPTLFQMGPNSTKVGPEWAKSWPKFDQPRLEEFGQIWAPWEG